MGILRLPIVHMDKETYAQDGGVIYRVVNPQDIPKGYDDGIFSLDQKNVTARFESRQTKPPFITVPWKHVRPTTRSTTTRMPDGTVVHRLCSGHLLLTIKPGDEDGQAMGYAEGENIPDEVLQYTLVQALAGIDVASEQYTEALESMILWYDRKNRD